MPPKAVLLGGGAGLRGADVGDGGRALGRRAAARRTEPGWASLARRLPRVPGCAGVACLIMACSWNSPSRPTTPVTAPSREAGICGDAVLTMAREASPGAWTDSKGVPSAAETTDAVPLTGQQRAPRFGRAHGQPLGCAARRTPAPPRPGSARTALHTAPRSGSGGSRASRGWRPRRRLRQSRRVLPGQDHVELQLLVRRGRHQRLAPAGRCGAAWGRTICPGEAAPAPHRAPRPPRRPSGPPPHRHRPAPAARLGRRRAPRCIRFTNRPPCPGPRPRPPRHAGVGS